jgi:hypothetical protein
MQVVVISVDNRKFSDQGEIRDQPRLLANEHQQAVQMKKVLWLAASLAVVVLAGCSSLLSTKDKHLTGNMDEWVKAVCERGPQPLGPGRYLSGAQNLTECFSTMQTAEGGRSGPVPILIGVYTSDSLMKNDVDKPYSVGAHAEGNDGTNYVVFASLWTRGRALAAESTMLKPLQAYGFTVHPSPNSSVEPSPPAQSPGNANAMPPPGVAPTAPDPPLLQTPASRLIQARAGRSPRHSPTGMVLGCVTIGKATKTAIPEALTIGLFNPATTLACTPSKGAAFRKAG